MNRIQKIESKILRIIRKCLRNWKRKQKKKQIQQSKSRRRVSSRKGTQTRRTASRIAQRKTGKISSQKKYARKKQKNVRKIQEKRRQIILKTAAFAAVGLLSAAGVFLVKKLTIQAEALSPKKAETVVEKAQEENTRQYMYGIESIISGVCISQDTDSEVNKLGTSCEAVLVGQRIGKNQQESNLDFSEAAADTVEKLENHSLDVEQYLKVTDRDYETLLKIVEAEAGGEDTEGKIMVANVIFNRLQSPLFPDNIYDIVWQNTDGTAQFSPTADGRINTVTVSEDTREAVNRAIDGEDYSQGALFFMQEEYSDADNVSWFKSDLEFLFKHGVHAFYTYPEKTLKELEANASAQKAEKEKEESDASSEKADNSKKTKTSSKKKAKASENEKTSTEKSSKKSSKADEI